MDLKRSDFIVNRRFELEYCFERRLSINFECALKIRSFDFGDFKISAVAAIGWPITMIAIKTVILVRILHAF